MTHRLTPSDAKIASKQWNYTDFFPLWSPHMANIGVDDRKAVIQNDVLHGGVVSWYFQSSRDRGLPLDPRPAVNAKIKP